MATNRLSLFKLWFPPIVWAIVIYIFSSLAMKPALQFYWADFLLKKSAHITEYAVLSLLLYRAIKESLVEKRRAAIYAIFIAMIYAATDEFHQSFTPGRQPAFRDIIFDTIGAISSIYLIWKLLPKAPKKLRIWAGRLQLA